jgi:uncharacterized membrane protein YphA (DoxX/SURF4 family)
MKNTYTLQGQSFVFNALFILINLTGLTLVTMGFHENFENSKWLLVISGFLLMGVSVAGLIILKGRLFMSYVSRVLVGGLFIVSGLIKANDPLGFSYKLEEYFEDGALAFRIKEWFGAPGFSLEWLIPFALWLSVIICIAEIVLGVLVLIGGKVKTVSWLLVVMMLFFTFLTWHTANCDSNKKFVDRDTYELKSEIASIKMEEAKTNKEIKIVSKTNGELVVDEMKQPQCVSDCGCFGDAMKGSIGRSLTPKESLWKDIVLLYLVVWIFISQRRIVPNTAKDNAYIVPISLVFVTFFSFIFGWYFPLLFSIVAILAALWILRAGGKYLGNHWGSALVVTVLCTIMTTYVLRYEPIKDYRPYSVGSDLKAKMNDGVDGKYLNMLVYKNIKNGETKEFDGSSQAYINSKIWEKTDTWKYDTMVTKEIIPTKLPSITQQFNPIIAASEIGKAELSLKYIKNKMSGSIIPGYLLFDKSYQTEIEVAQDAYNTDDYDTSSYRIIKEIEMANPDLAEISIKDYILEAPTMFIVFSRDLLTADFEDIQSFKTLYKQAKYKKIPFIMITSASREDINAWRKKNSFEIPVFTNDPTELKAIARSNPSFMIVQKGVVKGKYAYRSLPKFDWIQKHVLNKK